MPRRSVSTQPDLYRSKVLARAFGGVVRCFSLGEAQHKAAAELARVVVAPALVQLRDAIDDGTVDLDSALAYEAIVAEVEQRTRGKR